MAGDLLALVSRFMLSRYPLSVAAGRKSGFAV